jgi:hypothetical protein
VRRYDYETVDLDAANAMMDHLRNTDNFKIGTSETHKP